MMQQKISVVKYAIISAEGFNNGGEQMSRFLIIMGLSVFAIFLNTSSLQGEETDSQRPDFKEVHGWPGSRCNICHTSAEPGPESASLIEPDQSRLCESCHKGKVTILPGLRLGSRVEKMANHPIKFSPMDFDSKRINHTIIEGKNHFYVSGKTGKVPIFGATAETAVVECTTCHDSHGKSHMPKMPRISNASGEMCLVCHLIEIKISEYYPDADLTLAK